MYKYLVIVLLPLLVACGNSSTEEVKNENQSPEIDYSDLEINLELEGKITGAKDLLVTLEALSQQGTIEIGKTATNGQGYFDLKANIKGMGLYQLRVGGEQSKIIPLTLVPNDKVKITADYATFERLPKIEGTEWAATLTKYMSLFNDFAAKQMTLAQKTELSREEQIEEFKVIRQDLDAFAYESVVKDPGNPANIVLSTSLTPVMGFEHWDKKYLPALEKIASAYGKKYKDSPIAKSMEMQVKQIESGYEEFSKFEQTGSASLQKTAPEIALKNPEGKVIKLSSLRGKVVLIDFWASWCGPCRKENPNVVNVYNKYKNKGFTVYSVSLDKDAEAWKRAIKSDGLVWPNHVSDLKQWESDMPRLYGFEGIPYTVLIDKKGKIIATNLRGPALEAKLKEVL